MLKKKLTCVNRIIINYIRTCGNKISFLFARGWEN